MPKNYKDETTRKVKRIFYTNITYGCNSICLFCYSHNTKHSKVSHNEISKKQLVDYWNNMKVCSDDRVIINGGEPFIHSEIEDILLLLKNIIVKYWFIQMEGYYRNLIFLNLTKILDL